MSEHMKRREFLSQVWIGGAALIGLAGAWTSWDLLQPLPTTGFGGKVRALPPESVTGTSVLDVPAARSYLTEIDGEVVALSEKCTHLGCRVPFCESSGQFECPCHGSIFNRAGDFVSGPAPRGLDTYPTEIGEEDGLIYIDTGSRQDGGAPGSLQIDEPAIGPACAVEGGHS